MLNLRTQDCHASYKFGAFVCSSMEADINVSDITEWYSGYCSGNWKTKCFDLSVDWRILPNSCRNISFEIHEIFENA